MKIYTRQGDTGHTQIYVDDVVRVEKHSEVLECYGTLDELNAHIGLLHSMIDAKDHKQKLQNIQHLLFQIGFAISAESKLSKSDIDNLESDIDTFQASLPAQTSFILPGGCPAGAQAHVCRTVARRAERRLVALLDKYPVASLSVKFLNRLSDWLFAFSRVVNHQAGAEETKV